MKSIFSDNNVIDKRFADTKYVVEADSYSMHNLWYEYHRPGEKERTGMDYGVFVPDHAKVEWNQDSHGAMYQTGELKGRPVCTSFVWADLDGYKVVFYENTSQVVDTVQVEKWFNKHCKPMGDSGRRINRTNASNFHHVIHYIRDLQEAKNK